MKDNKCVHYGDCPFNHAICQEDEPWKICKDRKIEEGGQMRQPERSCPFCGDIDQIRVIEHYTHNEKGVLNTAWFCGCSNFRCSVMPNSKGKTRDEAIDNWERRAE